MSGTILIRPAPNHQENIVAYVLRVSEANGFEHPRWLLERCGLSTPNHPMPLSHLAFGTRDVMLLAAALRKPASLLASLQYQTYRQGHDRFCRFMGHELRTDFLRIDRPRLCPACVKEKGFIPQYLDFAWITVCPQHQCLLVDRCPCCGARLLWARPGLAECACRFDFRTSAVQRMAAADAALSMLLFERLDGNGHNQACAGRHNRLYGLDLESIVALIHLFAMLDRDPAMEKLNRFPIKTLLNAELHGLAKKAFSLFADWPRRLCRFLRDYGYRRMAGRQQLGMTYLYAPLTQNLQSGRYDGVQFQFLKEAVDQFLRRPLATEPSQCSDSFLLPACVDLETAAATLGISLTHLETLVRSKVLKPFSHRHCMREKQLFHRDDLLALRDRITNGVSLKQSATILGVSEWTVRELIRARLVQAWRDAKGDGSWGWHVDARSLNQLLERLEAMVSGDVGNDDVSARAWLRGEIGAKILKFSTILELTLTGAIQPTCWDKRLGVAGLYYRKHDLFDLKRPPRTNEADVLTIPVAAQRLGLYPTAVYRFIEAGLLRTRTLRINSATPQMVVTKPELDRFQKTYVTAGELAKSLDCACSGISLSNRLMHEGIAPISGPTIDGALIFAYRRVDLAGVDLGRLVRQPPRWRILAHKGAGHDDAERAKHKNVGYLDRRKVLRAQREQLLDAKQVAVLLGTTYQKVGHLVAGGFLKDALAPGIMQNKRFFSKAEINRYVRCFAGNDQLVTVESAAQRLNIPRSYFYAWWVAVIGSKIEDSGLARFVNTADLQRAIEISQDFITSGLAEIQYKVSKGSIGNWRRMGRLTPARTVEYAGKRWFLYRRTDFESLSH